MKKLNLSLFLFILSAPALWAQDPYGIWQTQTGKGGAYLHVKVSPCKTDRARLCGHVHETFKTPHTEIVGRPIFWGHEEVAPARWENGKLWEPERNKVFRSKVSLQGAGLRVEGCLGPICQGQTWHRVK